MKKTATAIMDCSLEYVDDCWTDLLQETEFDSFAKEYLTTSNNSKLNCLVNVDYSLNSPLIPDEIEELIKYLNTQKFRNSWAPGKWTNFKTGLRHCAVSPNQIKQPLSFHKWWGKINQLNPKDTSVALRQLEIAQTNSDLTFPIIRSFIKGWLGKNIRNPARRTMLKSKPTVY